MIIASRVYGNFGNSDKEKIVFLSVEANIMMDIAILQKSALAVAMKAGNDESFLPKVNAQFVKPDLLSVAKFFLFHICNLEIYKWAKMQTLGKKFFRL